ncbi:DUF3558 family protein [Saccharomonospora iraqiensis]|uniref:DUF3558 family protein n=1 Tax=Saccharomonospora iraqiensis TaxID=52698 RepID=UPI000A02CA36|nr:DUF3558 family protein [Saccharomonospora iraqiensis]
MTVAALVLSACSQKQSGTAAPDVEESEPLRTPSVQQRAGLRAVEPCSLLDPGETATFGEFEKGSEGVRSDGGRQCHWEGVRQSAQEDGVPSIYVVIEDDSSIEELGNVGDGARSGVMKDSGRAVKETWNETGCVVGLAVGNSSRVDVIVADPDREQSCAMANKIAELVEPKLPMR